MSSTQAAVTGASSNDSSALFISPRAGDMLLSTFEVHLELRNSVEPSNKLRLSLRARSDPSVEVPLQSIDANGSSTYRATVETPAELQAGYHDLLARLDDSQEPIASISVRKMPYGATRSKAALCYTAGLGMRDGLLSESKLRIVPADSIRDASQPAITAEIESDTHDREPPAPRGNDAFFYKPEKGSTLERNFTVYFVDPTALDQEVTLHLQSNITGEEGVLLLKTKMDGNRLRQRVDLPKGVDAGEYNLTVRRAGAVKATLEVKVASA